jgi:hypothetical protein
MVSMNPHEKRQRVFLVRSFLTRSLLTPVPSIHRKPTTGARAGNRINDSAKPSSDPHRLINGYMDNIGYFIGFILAQALRLDDAAGASEYSMLKHHKGL